MVFDLDIICRNKIIPFLFLQNTLLRTAWRIECNRIARNPHSNCVFLLCQIYSDCPIVERETGFCLIDLYMSTNREQKDRVSCRKQTVSTRNWFQWSVAPIIWPEHTTYNHPQNITLIPMDLVNVKEIHMQLLPLQFVKAVSGLGVGQKRHHF